MLFDTMSIMTYTFGIVLIYVVCLFFIKPLKLFFKLLINLAFGAVMIYIINFAGGVLGIKLGINFFTSAVSGFMGLPGIIMLYAVKVFL